MKSFCVFVNDRWIEPVTPYGAPALDFIRGEMGLTGTKEGCREGDCGACAVLVGERIGEMVRYRAMPSCILALGDLRDTHLITIEGLREDTLREDTRDGLTPVQKIFLEENASQCGFCTPGFIISLTAWLCQPGVPEAAGAMTAVDGNLCRCTGYGAIRRAAEALARAFADLPEAWDERLKMLVARHVLPPSVLEFLNPVRGSCEMPNPEGASRQAAPVFLGGGTDFFVRNPDPEKGFSPMLLRRLPGLSGVRAIESGGTRWLEIGAATTVRDFFGDPLVRSALPGIEGYEREFASTLIRNVATLGGNIANASPVGDLTSMFMGLGASLEIGVPGAALGARRHVPIEAFFLGYKKTDLAGEEAILSIRLDVSSPPRFSFAKISKRKNLDIAAVNTAMSFIITDGRFRNVRISAGGVAPIPVLLTRTAALLEGRNCPLGSAADLAALARETAACAESEVTPIGDVRGSAEYRRRMTGRLTISNFLRIFEKDGGGLSGAGDAGASWGVLP